jgi:hypothetical protein
MDKEKPRRIREVVAHSAREIGKILEDRGDGGGTHV